MCIMLCEILLYILAHYSPICNMAYLCTHQCILYQVLEEIYWHNTLKCSTVNADEHFFRSICQIYIVFFGDQGRFFFLQKQFSCWILIKAIQFNSGEPVHLIFQAQKVTVCRICRADFVFLHVMFFCLCSNRKLAKLPKLEIYGQ